MLLFNFNIVSASLQYGTEKATDLLNSKGRALSFRRKENRERYLHSTRYDSRV